MIRLFNVNSKLSAIEIGRYPPSLLIFFLSKVKFKFIVDRQIFEWIHLWKVSQTFILNHWESSSCPLSHIWLLLYFELWIVFIHFLVTNCYILRFDCYIKIPVSCLHLSIKGYIVVIKLSNLRLLDIHSGKFITNFLFQHFNRVLQRSDAYLTNLRLHEVMFSQLVALYLVNCWLFDGLVRVRIIGVVAILANSTLEFWQNTFLITMFGYFWETVVV